MSMPLPRRLGEHVALARQDEEGWRLKTPGTNLALVLDRGYDDHTTTAKQAPKQVFLDAFCNVFTGDLAPLLARRKAALNALGAESLQLFTRSRLVVGLGLPSPLETGFLLDRLSGCPYLPGSSVKGLARATASLIAKGELPGAREFWLEHEQRVFGPPLGEGNRPARGSVVFFDAYPEVWPKLVVELLTPHFGDYYLDGEVPGDWGEPVPVPFLAVEVGQAFLFYLRALDPARGDEDRQQVEQVLRLGLEQLGIGGKRSGGFGVLGEKPEATTLVSAAAPEPTRQERRAPPPPRSPRGERVWKGAMLRRGADGVEAFQGSKRAVDENGVVEAGIAKQLRREDAKADVTVAEGLGSWRIVKVENVQF